MAVVTDPRKPPVFYLSASLLLRLSSLLIFTALCYFSFPNWFSFNNLTSAQAQGGTLLQARVVNENDQPQAGATVSVQIDGVFVQSILTPGDGQFNVSLPRAGQYSITINMDGYRTLTETIPLGKDETLFHLFKLVPSSLHVVVLDNVQEKLADAVVTLKGNDGGLKRAIESPKGDYYFGRLKAGIYQLAVLMPGFEVSVDESVYIASDNKTMLRTVLLQRASAIPIGDKLKERYTVPLLPANRIQAIWQDRLSGAIWLGSNHGLARYNGNEMHTSESQDGALSNMAGEDIRAIFQDSRGNIWFASTTGLHIKRPDARQLEAISVSTMGLADHKIRALTEDHYGALWFATDHGVVRFNNNGATEFTTKLGLPSDDVRHITVDRQGEVVWVATAAGVARIERSKVKLLTIKGETVRWPTNFILIDSRNTSWLLTENGLKRQIGEDIMPVLQESLNRALVSAVEDRVGNIWFAAASQSVYVYDLRHDEVDDQLGSDRVLSMMADREGNIWFGSENGAVRQDFYSFVNFNTSRGLPETDINCLLPDTGQPEALWVGSANGLIHFDGITFRRVLGVPINVSVRHILQQVQGTLWVATSDGLYRYQDERWQRFGVEDGLVSADIRYLCEDVQDGNLWVATKKGVLRFDTTVARGLSAAAMISEPIKITAEVRQIYQQSNKIIWFATDRGVYRYDPATYDLTIIGQNDGLESIDVRWIDGDEASGVLWFATAKGVEVFKGQRVATERRLPGLTGENIESIFRDRDQMIWLGSTDGKVKKYLNPSIAGIPPFITTYTRDRHGLAGNEIRAITQDSSGAIWFATEAGLTRHLPSLTIPTVECRVEVDGAEVSTYDLDAGRHNIKFRFEGLNTMGEISFLYRIIINGVEKEYRLIGAQSSGSHEALFLDLPDGEHIFEVRAINRDLYGINAQPLQLHLHIDRPFWKKLWFYLFIGISMTTVTVTSVAVRQRQRREYVLPAHLRTFIPIDPNPYIVGNPIRTPSMFFGREDDFNYLKTKLEGAAQGGVVMVFCGERRAGKSSILYQILNHRLGDRFIPVFIDLQEMVVSNDHEFFGRIAKLIGEAVAHANEVSLTGQSTREIVNYQFSDHTKNAFHLFVDYLNSILSLIGDRRLLILMDEYELLENKVDEGKLSKDIFTFMASLIDNRDRLSFVFTGSRRLDERDRRYWRELLRRSLFRKVSFLSERDAKRLVIEPVRDKLVYGRGVEDAIYRLTSGQPFYTQYICQAIVDHLNEWKRNYVLKSDLKTVIDEIIDNPLPQMIYFWDGFSDDEKLVMSLLSEVLKNADSAATAGEIAEAIKREHYPVTLTTDTIRLTLEELFRTDVLKKIGEDSFCFRIDLFRSWIKHSHSIWRVVREVRTL